MRYACVLDWHINVARADRWLDAWLPVAGKVMAYGALGWSLTRDTEDILHFRHTSWWEDKDDFEGWWYDEQVEQVRTTVMDWHHKPLLPVWHALVAAEHAPEQPPSASEPA